MPTRVKTFPMAQVLPGGFHMPTRMTALPLADGGLALVSPIRLTKELAAQVEEQGPVRFLIAPNLLHHLYLAEAVERWPTARVLAPRALRAKRPDLRIDADLEDALPPELASTVRVAKIEGAPSVDEFAFFHEPSRTAVLTDLLFHLTAPKGFVAHVTLWLVGCHGKLAQSRAWRIFVKDRTLAARSARTLLAWPIHQAILAHGEPIEGDVLARLEQALRWMTSGDGLLAPASNRT